MGKGTAVLLESDLSFISKETEHTVMQLTQRGLLNLSSRISPCNGSFMDPQISGIQAFHTFQLAILSHSEIFHSYAVKLVCVYPIQVVW